MTYGRIVSDLGGLIYNGAYAGDRIARLKLDKLNCGTEDFLQVLEDYEILFRLQEIDEKYITEALMQSKHPLTFFPGDLFPEALEFTLEDFQNMVNTALNCIVGEPEASELNYQIRKLIDYLNIQLNFRSNLFDMINRDFSALL